MELELFQFIEDTITYYNENKEDYECVMRILRKRFAEICSSYGDSVVSFKSRIKEEESLKEKLIRNQFYLDYQTGEEAILHLSDLIGITIQCRFIRNENEIYQNLLKRFELKEDGYAQCLDDSNLYLNLRMPQPQYQRNGFTIYRIDGYYQFEAYPVNFELQIKSMVHNFWSDIEHQVVYKNPGFAAYDQFNKAMLGAIRDNLDVVDRQLEIMYNEISEESSRKQIGMDEIGFKTFVAQSINELVNRKLIESVGFTTDFKKCSAILAQYVYVKDFVNGEHNHELMVAYLEHLNYLVGVDVDVKQKIYLEHAYHSEDVFCQKLGTFWENIMNVDFKWHIFFTMLFLIQPESNYDDFDQFIHIIEMLIIQPGWYRGTFETYSKEQRQHIQDDLLEILADGMIACGKIEIVHEDYLYRVMGVFKRFVVFCEEKYKTYDAYVEAKEAVRTALEHQIMIIFQ